MAESPDYQTRSLSSLFAPSSAVRRNDTHTRLSRPGAYRPARRRGVAADPRAATAIMIPSSGNNSASARVCRWTGPFARRVIMQRLTRILAMVAGAAVLAVAVHAASPEDGKA